MTQRGCDDDREQREEAGDGCEGSSRARIVKILLGAVDRLWKVSGRGMGSDRP